MTILASPVCCAPCWGAARCLALLSTGAAGTVIGQVYLVLQALGAARPAELQWFGVRRAPRPGSA